MPRATRRYSPPTWDSPHLHYEVIHMGQVVNPINYFNRNMTNEEYERLMEQMQELNLDTFDE